MELQVYLVALMVQTETAAVEVVYQELGKELQLVLLATLTASFLLVAAELVVITMVVEVAMAAVLLAAKTNKQEEMPMLTQEVEVAEAVYPIQQEASAVAQAVQALS